MASFAFGSPLSRFDSPRLATFAYAGAQ